MEPIDQALIVPLPKLVTHRNVPAGFIAIISGPLPDPSLTVPIETSVPLEWIEYSRMVSSTKFVAYRKLLLGVIAIPLGPCFDPAATASTRVRLPVVVLRVNSEMVPELKLVTNARVAGLAVPVGVAVGAVPVGVDVGVLVLVAVTVGKIEPPHATMPTVPARSSKGGKIAKIFSAVESLDNNFF